MGEFGQNAGVTPLLFFSKDILGFLMTAESQDLGLTSHPNVSNLYIGMSKRKMAKKAFRSVNLFGTGADKSSSPQIGSEFILVNVRTFPH